ncbi:hypothetical protein BYT27DRAFT_7341696 [Phlegmacium glaucopus]|nr:hypothetical protein BYT27DRAFT_7341696 [Phlegmacium glaucopus]
MSTAGKCLQMHTSVYTLRGVRRLSPKDWRSYILTCQPDIVFSLSDISVTDPPYSQEKDYEGHRTIILQMAGRTSIPARRAFAESLLERLHGPEVEAIKPLEKLDDASESQRFYIISSRLPSPPPGVLLCHLPVTKLRLINSTKSPHEILQLVSTIGIDLFDAQWAKGAPRFEKLHGVDFFLQGLANPLPNPYRPRVPGLIPGAPLQWAQHAPDVGIALDFQFPVCGSEIRRTEIGHNLYDSKFSLDFNPLANTFRGVCTADIDLPVCLCAACSPKSPSIRIFHGVHTPSNDELKSKPQYKPPFTRAYIHHLLHTREMSARALLVLVSSSSEGWMKEVDRFMEMYDESLGVFEAAKLSWTEVDLARGRGRLVRERMMQEEIALATDADAELCVVPSLFFSTLRFFR